MVIGLDETAQYVSPGNAPALLQQWLAVYTQAHRSPPTLLPRCCLAAATAARGKDNGAQPDMEAAAEQALKAWVGNERVPGEGGFDTVRALWREQPPIDEAFTEQALLLFGPLLANETVEKLA
jgi:exonuclease V gamma subunit